MNLNILSYIVYSILTGIFIIHVGLVCYRNGNVYLANLLPHNLALGKLINKVLLIGYYLLNLGFAVYMISTWKVIHTPQDFISHIAKHSGNIIILLAILHYINMICIHLLFNKQLLSKF